MIIFKTVSQLDAFVKKIKAAEKKIGFVPTMGALHLGHISLVKTCKKENDLAVCSIFVNPTQFNNVVDYEKYPVTIETDLDKLEDAGCDVVFLPSLEEVYPKGKELPVYELGYVETVLEGKFRPGHYQGVCRVVDRLLMVVKPVTLYLGQKDYQQCMVIKKLIDLNGFNIATHVEKTVREHDGLAMSSRNARLNDKERKQAGKIFETLSFIKNSVKRGRLESIKVQATTFLSGHGFKVDYVEIADATSLEILQHWNGTTTAVALVAAYLNEVRLIDNFILD